MYHCQSDNDNKTPDFDNDLLVDVIKQVHKEGITKIGFTGGEPLLRKGMTDVLYLCKKLGMVTSIVSNSWFVKKYIKALKTVDLLFLSLDGDDKTHDEIRGPGNYDKFIEAVTIAKENNVPVAALSCISTDNADKFDKVSKIIKALKIHWMVGLIQVDFLKEKEKKIEAQTVTPVIKNIRRNRYLRTANDYLNIMMGKKEVKRCYAGIGYAVVGPDAHLYPCFPAQLDPDFDGISLAEHSFKDAFQKMPLYRSKCDTCTLACHMEVNNLYEFNLGSIMNSLKLMRPTPKKIQLEALP